MSETDKFRRILRILWVGVVLVALLGWIDGRDISQLDMVVAWVVGALAIGEGANIGKRATWKREAYDAETDEVRGDA